MATVADIVARVRKELGDLSEPFRQSYRGTGTQDQFDLPVARVSTTGLNAYTVDPTTAVTTTLVLGTDFTLDSDNGLVILTTPLAKDLLLVVEGSAFGMFTDNDLTSFVTDALLQHTNQQYKTTRYRDSDGFIRYDRVAKDIDNLPEVEEFPLALLATIEALWALATDASTDIDVVTSEGTHVPRTQRFEQLQTQIAFLQGRYETLCGLLGVGLYKIEMENLRRISRTTNRYVPLFVEREYDETAMPMRITPEIDVRDADEDGPPSPAQNMGVW